MKIVKVTAEFVRADTTIAQFLVKVTLDNPVGETEVKGQVVGPRCPGFSTVEIAYPLSQFDKWGSVVVLKGVIPEPNLWSETTPFVYEIAVEVLVGGKSIDSRTTPLVLK